RDGAARTRLQSHPRHEHDGRPAPPGGNQGIVVADLCASAPQRLTKTARARLRTTSSGKLLPNRKKWPRAARLSVALRVTPRQDVSTRPRPNFDGYSMRLDGTSTPAATPGER